MLNLGLYIHSTGLIAPAADAPDDNRQRLASEPDYTRWIPPVQLRRTSKVVRMGIGAAKLCTEGTACEKPDALSIGTAMGCLQDTEVFLGKLVSQEEKMLTPTAFIQSTHNTVGGQIALLMGCHGHNMTYVHRGHSFEHAVINTKLYLQDHPGETVLTGGIDELTASSHLLMQRAGVYASTGDSGGAIAGEGAAFFTINEQAAGALLHIEALHLFIAESTAAALEEVAQFALLQDIDLLLAGDSGDAQTASFYTSLREMLPAAPAINFKQFCGEYATASACALSLLAKSIQGEGILQSLLSAGAAPSFKRALIVNHFCDHYSCWLIRAQ